MIYYLSCMLSALTSTVHPQASVPMQSAQRPLMLLNHLTFYFYNISSPSYSSRSHPLLPAPFFPFSHPGMSPILAGRPSLLPVARGHCHKRREDLNLINDQHESGQPASSIKSWSTLHWMYTFECVPVCVCVCVHRMSSMDIM